MNETRSTPQLTERQQKLSTITSGIRLALQILELSDSHRAGLCQTLACCEKELTSIKSELKKRKTDDKQWQAKYRRERQIKIEEAHGESGFEEERASFVEGGATGLSQQRKR